MEKEYLALLSLIAGACLGFFLDIQKEKRAQNIRWHEMYLNFSSIESIFKSVIEGKRLYH